MYGTQGVEHKKNSPLQGEPRSQEALPAAAVKYMGCCLMRFKKTAPIWPCSSREMSHTSQSFSDCNHTDESH